MHESDLAHHFAVRPFGLRPQWPTPGDLALLAAYDWPGNVCELASVIDRAAILGDGECLEVARCWAAPAATPATPTRGGN